jgi:hypothetical protein
MDKELNLDNNYECYLKYKIYKLHHQLLLVDVEWFMYLKIIIIFIIYKQKLIKLQLLMNNLKLIYLNLQ